MGLSQRQQKILDFLEEFLIANSYPPTIREIGRAVGISSTSVVNYNLEALERKGHIYRNRTVSRGLRLTKDLVEVVTKSVEQIQVPLLGRIAAGVPIPVPDGAYDADTDTIFVSQNLLPRRAGLYALKVKGTSMIDALINDGDLVVMESTNTAQNGEMVAAWLTDQEETTLKRFFHEGSQVRLQPENKTMRPIFVDQDKVEIQGRVVAVIRQMH